MKLNLWVGAAALLAACGGGSGYGTTGSTGGATAGATTTGSTTGTTAIQVDAKNTAFSPQAITVQVGQSVTWTNRDSFDHTVTSGAPGAPDGRFDHLLHAGESFTFTFTQAASVPYFCRIHVSMGMTGSVQVGAGSTGTSSTTGTGTATGATSTSGNTSYGTTRY